MQDEATNLIWEEQPYTIRAFLEVQSLYEKLSEEVSYILRKQVSEANIEYSTITYRTKTVESFCEKSYRKGYKEPLSEATDIAGTRIVYLYEQDRERIEEVIERNFKVIEKVNKLEVREPHEFGYNAIHYLVKLSDIVSGPRYDDLSELVCEIQVRTILQDAWAIVAHHLSYKKESDIPNSLIRKINALSGLFETADNQFSIINKERCQYRESFETSIKKNLENVLEQNINQDNLIAYSAWKMPDRRTLTEDSAVAILAEIEGTKYTKIRDIDNSIDSYLDFVKEYEKEYPPTAEDTWEKTIFAQAGVIRIVLSLSDDIFMSNRVISNTVKERLKKYREKIKLQK